jgi:hypothetical protein
MMKFNVHRHATAVTSTSTHKRSPAMSSLNKSTVTSTFATLFCLAALGFPHAASAYDAAGDFSSTSNPDGVWSYGSSTSLAGTFVLDTTNTASFHGLGLSGWLVNNPSTDFAPYVIHNGTASPITYVNTTWQPGQLALNPGGSAYALVRWTAPSSGLYDINATFSGLSSIGASTDVHILLDNVSIFNSAVNGSPAPTSYSGIQSVLAGDRIDFAVGFGGNGNDQEDVTGLSATITAVPEPGTLGLVVTGLGCLLSFRFLKRK